MQLVVRSRRAHELIEGSNGKDRLLCMSRIRFGPQTKNMSDVVLMNIENLQRVQRSQDTLKVVHFVFELIPFKSGEQPTSSKSETWYAKLNITHSLPQPPLTSYMNGYVVLENNPHLSRRRRPRRRLHQVQLYVLVFWEVTVNVAKARSRP